MKYKEIEYEDDMVIVYEGKKEIYRGFEDYEPMSRESWQWNEKKHCYELGKFKKYCLA